ncbi:MAG: DUF4329 domain-containing protein [Pseudomonadota bacterium]
MNARTNNIIYALCAVAIVVIVIRAWFNVKTAEDFVITVTQEEVQAFARDQLEAVQAQSFAQDIELCGIIFERTGGSLGATTPREGDEASCGISYFDEPGMRPVASFHTHAGQNDAYDSEVPSIQDLDSDYAAGMDGYVATPGGRFWRVDATGPTAIQICGPGCLAQDPKYKPCPAFAPEKRMSRADIISRQTGSFAGC